MRKWKLNRVLILLAPIFLMAVFVFFAQNRFLYMPVFQESAYLELRRDGDDRLEELVLDDGDRSYHGWGRRVAFDAPTVLYFGGNFEHSEQFFTGMSHSGRWQYFDSCNVVMIDYPGYGLSEGKTTYGNLLRMADVTYRFVSESDFYGSGKTIVMGLSLGTGIAVYVAANYDVDGLILMAPYNNGTALYNSRLNIFHGPVRLLIRNPLPSDELVRQVTAPALLFASEDDEVIPFAMSRQLYEACGDAEFVPLQGLGHTEIFRDRGVLEQIADFIAARFAER